MENDTQLMEMRSAWRPDFRIRDFQRDPNYAIAPGNLRARNGERLIELKSKITGTRQATIYANSNFDFSLSITKN